MKVDLGCGNNKKSGFIGVDIVKLPCVDIVHDLKVFPYPFSDNSVEYYNMDSIIEHLPDTFKVMEEIYRTLIPNGIVHIVTAYWNHHNSISNPQHISFFDEKSWQYFTKKYRGQYFNGCFEIIGFKYLYDYRNKFLFFNIKPLMDIASRFLCNIRSAMIVDLKKIVEDV